MAILDREYKISAAPPAEESNSQRWDAAAAAFVNQVQSFLPELRADELEAMTQAIFNAHHQPVPSDAESALAAKLIGHNYTQSEKLQLEFTSLLRYFERRRALLHDALTATQVAELLGTTRQTPHDRIERGTLLAVFDKGIWKFPAWQFDPEGPDGVIEGLTDVLKTLNGSNFFKLNWLISPHRDLDGLAPLAALKQGQSEHVLQEARAVEVW
jgi:hypothetical protein